MRVFRIQFCELQDDDDDRPIGRAMCYVTALNAKDIPKVLRKASRIGGPLPKIVRGHAFSVVNEVRVPKGIRAFSISVGQPPGAVNFLRLADRKESAVSSLILELSKDQPGLSEQALMGLYEVREIETNRRWVW